MASFHANLMIYHSKIQPILNFPKRFVSLSVSVPWTNSCYFIHVAQDSRSSAVNQICFDKWFAILSSFSEAIHSIRLSKVYPRKFPNSGRMTQWVTSTLSFLGLNPFFITPHRIDSESIITSTTTCHATCIDWRISMGRTQARGAGNVQWITHICKVEEPRLCV